MFDCHSHSKSLAGVTIVNSDLEPIDDSFFSMGIHPWDSRAAEDNFLIIEQNATKKNCLAIGEIGLDKLKGPDLGIQKQVFIEQIKISEKVELPVIIHCVKAWNEIGVLKRGLNPRQTWIFHGFSKVGILKSVLENGLMISIGTAVLTNIKLQEALPGIPDNRLLLETDNAPVDIFEVYKKVSEIKQISLPSLEKIIEENFKRTFRKWQIGSNVRN